MSADWPTVRLGDYIDSTLGKMLDKKKNKGVEQPYLGNSDVRWGYFDLSNLSQMKFEDRERERYEVKCGDLIICEGGEPGRCAVWKNDVQEMRIQKALHRVRPKPMLNTYFLYYWLLFSGQRGLLEPYFTGTTIKHLTGKALKELEIKLPPLEYQQYGVKILKSLDDKISLNNQTNQTLESLAQAIFKSWFVDFEPTRAKIAAKANSEDPERAAMAAIAGKTLDEFNRLYPVDDPHESSHVTGEDSAKATLENLKATAALFPERLVESELGEVPEGWGVASINDVCNFQNGYAFKSKEMTKSSENSLKVFKMGHIKKGGGLNRNGTKDYYEKDKAEKLERYLLKKGDLLMCMTDMKNNVALLGHTALMDIDDEYIINQRVGLLRTRNKDRANYPFLYILTNSDSFIKNLRSRANSGVQVNLSTSEIKDTKFILPSINVHISFNSLAERIQENIFSLELEQDHLKEIRDTLLPKLLSGELRIPDAEKLVADAL